MLLLYTVVICFQNLYLWLSDTTKIYGNARRLQLWFAFKIYIFGFLIQQSQEDYMLDIVVICFQNLYLWLSDTTCSPTGCHEKGLWFAFKIYIFGFLIQQVHNKIVSSFSCDLLSKFISLAFWYNLTKWQKTRLDVVICFQNLYLWLSDTTGF